MNLKSYLFNKELNFNDMTILPIHIGNMDGRYYFSFAENVNPPAGGKSVSSEEIGELRGSGMVFRQIKQKAEERIVAIAPLWRQQNALADLYMLGQKESLLSEEQERFSRAQQLLETIQAIRNRSNEIEESLLNGIAVDYQTDPAWEI
jgi:hypothetical protein